MFNLIGNYSLRARVNPVILTLLPLIISAVVYSFHIEDYTQLLTYSGVSLAILFFLSQVGRDQGLKKEKELWNSWGGAPTIQLLRLSNSQVDRHTKKYYHDLLKVKCPIDTEPSLDLERDNPDEADEIYLAWSKFLISQTRDIKKFNLLFTENVNYGFRRNLWGLKRFAIALLTVTMLMIFGLHTLKFSIEEFANWPIEFFICELLLLTALLLWFLIVNRDWVKVPAFAYASRLLEQVRHV